MENQKHLFSLDPEIHYLNNAYKAPLLKSAEEALVNSLERERNPSLFKPDDFFNDANEIRTLFSQLVGCTTEDVAIIPSTSYGFASVFNNIEYEEGKHALTVNQEFPSDYFAVRRWCDDNDAALRIIEPKDEGAPSGEAWNKELLEAINEKTAVLIISSVHWMNGLKFDLEAIGNRCEEVGAYFIVDGTQSVGAAPLDVKKCKIDALICASYKWLFGPYSTGLAYFAESFHNGAPIEESWMNRNNAKNFKKLTDYDSSYLPGAARYSVGESSNFLLLPMLKASLKQVNKWGVENIQKYTDVLSSYFVEHLPKERYLVDDKAYLSSHLLGLYFTNKVDNAKLKEALKAHKVILSERGASLRIAFQVYNTIEDVDALLKALDY